MNTSIVFENLSKKYDDLYALNDLNLEVKEGEVLGYLGPNGAGKTTTIRLLLGLINPTAGSAKIYGLDSQKNKVEAHRLLTYVPGETNMWPNLTGAETLHLLGKVHGSVDERYKQVLINRFDLDVSKKVRSYSKGNKQKLSLVAGLMTKTRLLVLDEPTSGLDPLMEEAFKVSITEAKSNKQTVFLSSHILNEVEALCDRVAILKAGKLIEVGTLASMRHLSSLNVHATFKLKPPDVSHIKNVTDVVIVDNRLSCQATGPVDELLKVIANNKPLTFTCKEPSLEELFLSHYGKN